MPGVAHRIFLIKLKKMFDFFLNRFKKIEFSKNKIPFFLAYITPRFPKKFSPFGPAVYIYIYQSFDKNASYFDKGHKINYQFLKSFNKNMNVPSTFSSETDGRFFVVK